MSAKGDRISAVLCDAVRYEDNGKALLIGVYSGDVLHPGGSEGTTWQPTFWINFPAGELGATEDVCFKLNLPGFPDPLITLFEFTYDNARPCSATFTGPPTAAQTGTLSLEMSRSGPDGGWLQILEKQILSADAAVASSPIV